MSNEEKEEKLLSVLNQISVALSQMTDEKQDGLLTLTQLAKRWNLSESQILENREVWDIPFIKMGRSIRYPVDAIRTWEKRNTHRAS